MAQRIKHLLAMRETQVRSLGWEDPLEKEMAAHSSILGWRISWTEEAGSLRFMGCKELNISETTKHSTAFTGGAQAKSGGMGDKI